MAREAVQWYLPRNPAVSFWLADGRLGFEAVGGAVDPDLMSLVLTSLLVSASTPEGARAVLLRQAESVGREVRPMPSAVVERALRLGSPHLPLARGVLRYAPSLAYLVFTADREWRENGAQDVLDEATLVEYVEGFLPAFEVPVGREVSSGELDSLEDALGHPAMPAEVALRVLEAWDAGRRVVLPNGEGRGALVKRWEGVLGAVVREHLEGASGRARSGLLALLAGSPGVARQLGRLHELHPRDVLVLVDAGVDASELVSVLPAAQRSEVLRLRPALARSGAGVDPEGMTHEQFVAALEATGWDQERYERVAASLWPLGLARNERTRRLALEELVRSMVHGARVRVSLADKVLMAALRHPACSDAVVAEVQTYLTRAGLRFSASAHEVTAPLNPPPLLTLFLRKLPGSVWRAQVLDDVERLTGRSYHERFADWLPAGALEGR